MSLKLVPAVEPLPAFVLNEATFYAAIERFAARGYIVEIDCFMGWRCRIKARVNDRNDPRLRWQGDSGYSQPTSVKALYEA